MHEKTISLEQIDPNIFFGSKNGVFKIVQQQFPKLKMVGRDDKIKVYGTKSEVELFEAKIDLLVNHVNQFNKINKADIQEICSPNYVPGKIDDRKVLLFGNKGVAIHPRTSGQIKMVESIQKKDLIIAAGPAGTGKTFLAIALAVKALKNKEVKRIILTRPAVEAGEHLGFLPGDMKEKLDPYLQPLFDALNDMIPAKKLESYMEDDTIQIAPLAYMRGRTLSNAFVILDEAQNCTSNQLKMFLTRMGENTKFVITGDLTQIDLPQVNKSGLQETIKRLESIDELDIIEFKSDEVLRHSLVKKIIDAYNKK